MKLFCSWISTESTFVEFHLKTINKTFFHITRSALCSYGIGIRTYRMKTVVDGVPECLLFWHIEHNSMPLMSRFITRKLLFIVNRRTKCGKFLIYYDFYVRFCTELTEKFRKSLLQNGRVSGVYSLLVAVKYIFHRVSIMQLPCE